MYKNMANKAELINDVYKVKGKTADVNIHIMAKAIIYFLLGNNFLSIILFFLFWELKLLSILFIVL